MLGHILCQDCEYLVGAGPARAVHTKLICIGPDPVGREQYRCSGCRTRWSIGPLGWARLADERKRYRTNGSREEMRKI